jgi:hypothetical protein
MKSILTIVIFLSLVVSGLAQTRNVVVGTNGAVVSPTNFWSADVTNARSGLGLGSAATNPASAFQASSVNLSNLASNNGLSLTNVQASNIVGVISITSPVVNFTNIAGTLSVAQGGTSATNAANARQNLGSTTVGDALFIATNAAAARTAIGATAIGSSVFTAIDEAAARTSLFLGSAATNAATAFQPSSTVLSNLASSNGASLTNIPVAGVVGALATNGSAAGLGNFPTVPLASNVTGTIAISNGGSGATTAGGARTNLGLGATNSVVFSSIAIGGGDLIFSNDSIYWATNVRWSPEDNIFFTAIEFDSTNIAATTRTNLGLGWSALTNNNPAGFGAALYGSGTNPVLYNTNGEVVSPTNFWQVAPIVTRFIESQPTTNQTTNITAGRNLHIHSIAFSTVGITNTIALPTTNSFNGDVALVVHQGPTSSVTAVRTAGASTNLITLNQFEEAVEFVYYNSVWQFNHNRSFVEPIFFSGTNAAANRAASVTNLFTPNTPLVFNTNGTVVANTGTNVLTFTNPNMVFQNPLTFQDDVSGVAFEASSGSNSTRFDAVGISFAGLAAATTRTNLGLGLPALTNTNNANFQAAIFNTNSVPTNSANVNAINFNTAKHWMEVNVVTNGVTNNFRIPLFK